MNRLQNDIEKVKQSRKWLLTCNNPEEHGWTLEKIVEILNNWKGVKYWCIGQEVGVNEKTPHIHFFIYNTSAILWTTIDNKFHGVHRDACNGTIADNRDYVFKINKWEGTEKGTLHDYESNQESGDPPEEKGSGYRTDLHTLYSLIKEGKSTFEILEEHPEYIDQFDKIDKVRQTIKEEEFRNTWRNIHVTYIYGQTGAGKTRSVMEKYGYSNVYRVTDYAHPFDSYKGQSVIIFEEFRSSLRIDDMLKYLDGYPVEFPARYNNKVACFTEVYIITNIDLRKQYPNVQIDEPMTYKAFLRRIHEVRVFTGNTVETFDTASYLKNGWEYTFDNPTPFDEGGGNNE